MVHTLLHSSQHACLLWLSWRYLRGDWHSQLQLRAQGKQACYPWMAVLTCSIISLLCTTGMGETVPLRESPSKDIVELLIFDIITDTDNEHHMLHKLTDLCHCAHAVTFARYVSALKKDILLVRNKLSCTPIFSPLMVISNLSSIIK